MLSIGIKNSKFLEIKKFKYVCYYTILVEMKSKIFESEFDESQEDYFNNELMTFQDNEDDLGPIIEFKPKKPKIRHKFYIAS